ncbi:hypothetical protein [Chroococcus sp. FPU101]|uniref:hypothetical protein n=1 Tax=Chroococcus sp. FPU101 TaxID=1974212 RepID=UPI001AA77570|nr:hypothetical protein [Chroococcus sp. FPU101]GFE70513.1 protein of unknown function DUF939 [Chroococcus sp. FPU101]
MDIKNSLILKQGLKFALGATLLTLFFWHRSDLLDNYIYPVFGYVSVVIEPVIGGAIIAGLGRLGGSALGGFIAAILINSYGINGAGFYIIPALTYIFAALICETYRWQAAYSQATLLGALIAMRAVGTSGQQNIWLYLRSRLFDNWIGIAFGMAVTLLFWPQSTQNNLNRNLIQVLQDIPRLFRTIIDCYLAIDLADNGTNLLNRIQKATQSSFKILAGSSHEFESETLVQENWSGILAIQSQLTRQLSDLIILKKQPQNLAHQFTVELNQLAEHLTQSCKALINLTHSKKLLTNYQFYHAEQDLEAIEGKLNQLRANGDIDRYPVPEVLEFYQFLQLVTRLNQELQLLQDKLIHKAEVTTTYQRSSLITFPKWTPLSLKRVLEIVGLGLIIGMVLAIIRHIEFPYPSAYEKVADIIVVGLIVTVIQPTRGRAIALALAATISLYVTLFLIYLIAKSFGYNPFSSGVVYFFTYISCTVMGFTPVARIGAIVAADAIGKDIFPYFEQGIKAALISVPIGAFLGVVLTILSVQGSASDGLEESFSVTFKQMGKLYQSLLKNTLSATDITQLKSEIAQAIAKHPPLIKMASLEQISSVLATQHKNRWNILLDYEQKIFAQLGTLEDSVGQQQILPELQAITQRTANAFNDIAEAITSQMVPQFPDLSLLIQEIETVEEKLLSLRIESRNYPLETLIPLSLMLMTIKAIATTLNQMSRDLLT